MSVAPPHAQNLSPGNHGNDATKELQGKLETLQQALQAKEQEMEQLQVAAIEIRQTYFIVYHHNSFCFACRDAVIIETHGFIL